MFFRASNKENNQSNTNPLEKYKILESQLSYHMRKDCIGFGTDAYVVSAKLNDKKVAVKCFYVKRETPPSPQKIFTEALAMIELQSPRVVEFIGVVDISKPETLHSEMVESKNAVDAQPRIVMKQYKSSLMNYLKDSKNVVTTEQQLKWATQISEAVAYIHEHGWLHNDLRADNIFLDENDDIVLGDFGYACRTSCTPEEIDINSRFITPEQLKCEDIQAMHSLASCSTDVYRLGTLLWQIQTRKYPFYEHSASDVESFRESKQLHEVIPDDCPPILKDIIQQCWNDDPSKRPSAKLLATRLQNEMSSLMKKIDIADNKSTMDLIQKIKH